MDYTSVKRWGVPNDLAGLNAALKVAFTAAFKPITELWNKIDRAIKERRRTHPNEATPTARVIMGYFYQYHTGSANVTKLASTISMMAMRFETFGQNKIVEFWQKWTDLERGVGSSMLPECKIVRLYAEMSKFKQIKEEMLAFDKLPDREQKDQKGYDNLLKIFDREAQRETRKVAANRAMEPLENVMANITNPSPKGGANYTGAPTDGGKDGGKNPKGKGKDPAGKGGKDKNSKNNQNATWNDVQGDPAQTPKGKDKGDKGGKKGQK